MQGREAARVQKLEHRMSRGATLSNCPSPGKDFPTSGWHNEPVRTHAGRQATQDDLGPLLFFYWLLFPLYSEFDIKVFLVSGNFGLQVQNLLVC